METNNNTPTVNYAYSALYLDQNCKWQRIPAIGLGYATKRDLWAALYKAAADIDIPCQSIKITTTRYYKLRVGLTVVLNATVLTCTNTVNRLKLRFLVLQNILRLRRKVLTTKTKGFTPAPTARHS